MVYGIIPTSIKLEPALKERIKKLSKIKQRTPHAIMKKAICLYLSQEEKVLQSQEEVAKRWQAAEMNSSPNQHIAHSAIATWLATWGIDENEEPPWQK